MKKINLFNNINFFKPNSKFIFLDNGKTIDIYFFKNALKKIKTINFQDLKIELKNLKKNNLILKSENIWVLNNKNYETVYTEKVNMEKDELYGLARWKIQEKTEKVMHDYVYDILTNNKKETPYFKKHLSAVMLDKKIFEEITSSFNSEKIKLHVVTADKFLVNNLIPKNEDKTIAFLKIKNQYVELNIYIEKALIFSRNFEIHGFNKTEINEENKRNYIDKVILEIQRNLDYLDRQLSINPFESIVFNLEENEFLNELSEEICKYFSIEKLNYIPDINLENKEELGFIPLEIFAATKINLDEEIINLILKPVSNTEQEFKFLLMSVLLIGLLISIVGSFITHNNKKYEVEIESLKLIEKNISEEIEKLKQKPVFDTKDLEKELNNLIYKKEKFKNITFDNTKINDFFYNILEDLSVISYKNEMIFEKIEIMNGKFILAGKFKNKNNFENFLLDIKNNINFKGLKINNIEIEETKDLEGLTKFNISSNMNHEIFIDSSEKDKK